MADMKIRTSKQPEERRQEMLDTAMRVFTQKGYEQTTMRDIAREMNVVPGLCYRYFESKEMLYKTAVKEYTDDYCAPIIKILESAEADFSTLHSALAIHFSQTDDNEKYHGFFHKPENKNFAIMLNYTICEILVPHFSNMLKRLAETDKVIVSDSDAYARILLFGLAALMDDDAKPVEQRIMLGSEIVEKLLTAEGR